MLFMGDLIEFPVNRARRAKVPDLRLDGSTLQFFECGSLAEYLEFYQMAEEGVKKRKPFRTFLNNALFEKNWIRFMIKGVSLEDPRSRYAIPGGGGSERKWFLLSQSGAELPAFIDFSESGPLDNFYRFHAINSGYGDLASVNISLPRTKGIRHAEIYGIYNFSLIYNDRMRKRPQ
jgi:hypothetical protein